MEQDLILVVDPDAASRAELTWALRRAGHAADNVPDADAALRYLHRQPACRVLLARAWLQPTHGPSSVEDWLEVLSREHPHIPVVLTASHYTAESIIRCFRHGAFDFLPRPFDTRRLALTVGAALEHARLRRQALAYRHNLESLISERSRKLRSTMIDLERSYDITLEAMGDALDLRDAETEGHSRRVTAYTIAIARAMRLSAAELKVIARGAFLHDIGKIATPDSILLKPGKLTPAETAIMREHCRRGYEMVRKIPFLADAAEIVHTHQEAFDGHGYPRGLRGSDIPLGARIFSIADSLDAITSDRPYRKGSSFDHALAEIERCKGSQFDPAIVEVFLALPRETWTTLRTAAGRHSHVGELVRAAAA